MLQLQSAEDDDLNAAHLIVEDRVYYLNSGNVVVAITTCSNNAACKLSCRYYLCIVVGVN